MAKNNLAESVLSPIFAESIKLQNHRMKHILLLFSFVTFTFSLAMAQLEVNPNPWVGTIDDVDLSDAWAEGIAHSSVLNTSTDQLSVRWELNVIDAPEEWKFLFCDNNACYPAGTVTNWDPDNNVEEPVILDPDSTSLLDLHIRPTQVAGSCVVELYLSLTSDPSTVLATAVYEVTISGPSSLADQVSIKNLRVFPNPSTDYFALTNSQGISKIMLYNVVGRVVRNFEVVEGKKYYIADLPDGIYLAGMIGTDGGVLRTMRISKRSLRP